MGCISNYNDGYLKSYNRELEDLTKIEQKLLEKYKVLYDEARETKNYKEILPETYEDIVVYARGGGNVKGNLEGYENPDLLLFLKQYINEYENLKYDELLCGRTEYSKGLNWNTLYELTDFETEILNPMIEEVQKQNEYESLINSIFDDEKLTVSNSNYDEIDIDER